MPRPGPQALRIRDTDANTHPTFHSCTGPEDTWNSNMTHNSFNSLALIAIRWNFGSFIKLGWLSPRELLCGGISTPDSLSFGLCFSPLLALKGGIPRKGGLSGLVPNPLATHSIQKHLQFKSNQREVLTKAIYFSSLLCDTAFS